MVGKAGEGGGPALMRLAAGIDRYATYCLGGMRDPPSLNQVHHGGDEQMFGAE
jgi:hypothetical protein